MKKFAVRFIFTGIIVMILLVTLYESRFNLKDIADAIFVVGIFTFFLSLISVTDASKIFYGMGYTFGNFYRSVILRQKARNSFYEYAQKKNKQKDNPLGVSMMIVGVVYIAVSVYIGFNLL